jgi:NTP pyrophosphatase (non-canonical NTP hydrolase)
MAEKRIVPRQELRVFARAMEKVLRQNDWKRGWKGDSPRVLMDRIWDEIRELEPAADRWARNEATIEEVQKELLDIANFCMMAWDRLEARSMRAVETAKNGRRSCRTEVK